MQHFAKLHEQYVAPAPVPEPPSAPVEPDTVFISMDQGPASSSQNPQRDDAEASQQNEDEVGQPEPVSGEPKEREAFPLVWICFACEEPNNTKRPPATTAVRRGGMNRWSVSHHMPL